MNYMTLLRRDRNLQLVLLVFSRIHQSKMLLLVLLVHSSSQFLLYSVRPNY